MVVASIMCRDNENVTPSWRSGFTSAVDSSSGLVVRIPGSHPGGPGSIPGNGNSFYGCSVCPTEVSTSVMDRYLNRVPRRHRHMTERVNGIKIIDEDGIRTHACRAHWISSPTP